MSTDTIADAPGTPVDARRRWLGLISVLLGQFMLVIDGTVVNVALPVIQADLHLTGARLTWVTSSYLIAFGGLLLLFGRLGDLVGRRRIFMLGLGLFTAASVACGLARSSEVLIVARFIQGIGAAGASSVVLAIIATEFPDPKDRTKAMSGYMFVSIAGGSFGLLVGGALTQLIDWHWIFLVNLPIGLVTIPLCRAVLRETPAQGLGRGVDVGGAVLVTGAAMTAIYALVATADHGFTAPAVVVPALAAVAMLVGFLVLESRHANPLMPLRILRIRSLIASSVVRGFLIMGIYGGFFFGVLELSHTLDFGPMRIGLAFLPQTSVIIVLSLGGTAWMIGRFGPRRVLLVGMSLIVVALVTFALRAPDAPYWPGRLCSYVLVGLGGGMSFLPLLTIAMSEVPPRDAGLGSAIVNISLQLSAAVDLAILGAISAHRSNALVAAQVPARAAAISGYHWGYATAAGGVAIGLVLAATLLRPRPDGIARLGDA
jgi:EmrB/QacA subfamily drug resistance transporter